MKNEKMIKKTILITLMVFLCFASTTCDGNPWMKELTDPLFTCERKGHKLGGFISVDVHATCSSTGIGTRICNKCDLTFPNVEIPVVPHDFTGNYLCKYSCEKTIFDGGNGSSGDPYLIANRAQLNAVRYAFIDDDYHYKLTNNISLSGINWEPIGEYSVHTFLGERFIGTFDGNGKTISGLTINFSTVDDTTGNSQGLFGAIDSGGEVKNLGLTGVSINANFWVGGVAGINYGMVQNCYVTGTVTSSVISTGGITGDNGNKIENCVALNPSISGTTNVGRVVGGSGGTRNGNYARTEMSITENGAPKVITSNASGIDGANVTTTDLAVENNWKAIYWNTASWGSSETSPWVWDSTSRLPKLWFE